MLGQKKKMFLKRRNGSIFQSETSVSNLLSRSDERSALDCAVQRTRLSKTGLSAPKSRTDSHPRARSDVDFHSAQLHASRREVGD